MANVVDVARFLLHLAGREPEPELMSHMRLQKLLYYVQGWALAVKGGPMFPNTIEAWTHGPVVRDLYPVFADYGHSPIPADEGAVSESLTDDDKSFVTSVWEGYKGFSATKLRQMTHHEPPWAIARGDCPPDEKCDAELTHASLVAYFSEVRSRTQIGGLEPDRLGRAGDDLRSGRGVDFDELVAGLSG